MAYDEILAERIRDVFSERKDVEIKKMFGGLCFMVSNHMCCGITKNLLMARVGPEKYEEYLQNEHTQEMNFTGKTMKGLIYINPEGCQTEQQLNHWLNICLKYIESLPPKLKK